MIVRYESSSSKHSFLNFNATRLISNNTTQVHEKVEKDNFSLSTTVLKLVFNLKTQRKESSKNEDMAASILYSDYETAETNNKEDITTLPAQTIATFIINNKRPTIIVYPTVSPESVVIPIVSCILGFPLLALLIICCLRRRAKLARERDRRRNYDMQDHAVSLVRFSPIHRLNNRSSRAISLCPERSLSRGFPSLELDTVLEERSDMEQTQTEIFNSDSPVESTSQNNSCSS